MRKLSLLLALCLMLSLVTGCGTPAETTVPSTQAPETTEPTTVPPTTMPIPTDPPDPKVIDYALTLPEGFKAAVAEENYFRWVSPNRRFDASFVSVERMERDADIQSLSETMFFKRIDPTQVPVNKEPEETTVPTETTEPGETLNPEETTVPTEPPVEVPEKMITYDHHKTSVDGWPAVFCEYTLVYEEYMAHVLRYEVIANDCNYVFTFSDASDDNEWLELYKETVETIDLILDTEGIELDYTGLAMYDLGCGLNIWAETDMKNQKAPGFTACIANRNVIILLMADDKQINNLTWMQQEDYADLLCRNNDLKHFKWDTYGNLCTSFYSTDENGTEYYNMICVKETEEDFWVCQMACLAEDQAKYAKAFSLWAASIHENGK